MVTPEDLDAARDACLACCGVLPHAMKRAVSTIWVRSGLNEAQWAYVSEVAPRKERGIRQPDGSITVSWAAWVEPGDTDYSREEVLQIWKKHEPSFLEPLERFENAMVKVFVRAGEIYENSVSRMSVELNDALLLANQGRETSIVLPSPATTFHEAALLALLQVLKFGNIWSDVNSLWPEGELRRLAARQWGQAEKCWKYPWKNHLLRFLHHQQWMMALEELAEEDAEGIAREVQFEWAAARATVGKKDPPKIEWSRLVVYKELEQALNLTRNPLKERLIEDVTPKRGLIRILRVKPRAHTFQVALCDLPASLQDRFRE